MRLCFQRATQLLAILALLNGGHALAAAMEDGQAAYNRGDFAAAMRLWRPLAEEGNARAQNNLGVLYENARGVTLDINEAVKWYRLAAEQGYGGAWNNLALIYALGRGIPRDPLRAYMWFDLAGTTLGGDAGKAALESRDVVAGTMSSGQIAEATEMARKCQAASYKTCETGDGKTLASLTPAAPLARAAPAEPDVTPAIATTPHEVTLQDYPADSLRLHESGVATVTYIVTQAGNVSTCYTIVTSGSERLDEAACVMVKKRWKYTPTTEKGKPTTIQYVSRIAFPRR